MTQPTTSNGNATGTRFSEFATMDRSAAWVVGLVEARVAEDLRFAQLTHHHSEV